MPRYPQHPSVRTDRTKASTKAELAVREPVEIEAPPERFEVQKYVTKDGKHVQRRVKADWHPYALETWREIQESPMLDEFLEADFGVLRQLLALESDFWERMEDPKHPNTSLISAEITRIRKLCGLVPMGRRSLQWTIAATDKQLKKDPKVIDVTSVDLDDANDLVDELFED